MRVAIIKDGIVDNIIVATQSVLDASDYSYTVLETGDNASIGDTFLDGVFTTPVPVPEDYTVLRERAYPPSGDQFDMLWHAMDAGTLPMVTDWFNTIKTVKDNHPKPS